MRRTLAVALAAFVLLAGGCARSHPAADKPAPTATSPAAERKTTGAAKADSTTPADVDSTTPADVDSATPADVDGLLGEVDKQLAGDSQPSDDQD